ncbi:ABC-type branched-subunit amino acid transport system substrate-binding protein [Kibdelosporangium banguiense]|uniref:ABC-type branched-subunit amino acid transport system substrate-binding protein n=1 Tax=Kibdelosporangium banguiense TaxID=1365924 RepID=A0ABS4TQ32_9PSEU|nr:ABC transporter substrate-binding protein [Kibdelosporangium banguiense]MBP2326060.1 ABC-type branched-subunit amino acid transport system substrate-binding protein [Kibdelosporangium banguiense]
MRLRMTPLKAACAAALVLVATACGNASSAGGGDSTEIKIGAWYPLSGAVSASGVPQRAGADAYFKMINDKGGINGRKVNWVVKDNAFDPQQTVQIARELIGQEKVVAIVAANGTSQAEAAFPFVLQQSKVPILNELGGLDSWYNPPRPGLFGTQTLYEDQAAALGAWVAQDGKKNVVVVHSDPAAFVTVAKAAQSVATKTDPSMNVGLMPVKFQSTDYSPVVSQVKAKSPDAIVLILASPEAAAFMKEAKLQGLGAPTYGYAPVAAASTLTLAGPAAEGARAVQFVKSPNDNDPAVQEFRDAMAKYEPGQPADFIALWGWTGAKVFTQIAQTIQGPVTAESLTKAYEQAKNVDPGVGPVMSFGPDKHMGTRDVQKVVVKDGKWVSEGDFYTPPAR